MASEAMAFRANIREIEVAQFKSKFIFDLRCPLALVYSAIALSFSFSHLFHSVAEFLVQCGRVVAVPPRTAEYALHDHGHGLGQTAVLLAPSSLLVPSPPAPGLLRNTEMQSDV